MRAETWTGSLKFSAGCRPWLTVRSLSIQALEYDPPYFFLLYQDNLNNSTIAPCPFCSIDKSNSASKSCQSS